MAKHTRSYEEFGFFWFLGTEHSWIVSAKTMSLRNMNGVHFTSIDNHVVNSSVDWLCIRNVNSIVSRLSKYFSVTILMIGLGQWALIFGDEYKTVVFDWCCSWVHAAYSWRKPLRSSAIWKIVVLVRAEQLGLELVPLVAYQKQTIVSVKKLTTVRYPQYGAHVKSDRQRPYSAPGRTENFATSWRDQENKNAFKTKKLLPNAPEIRRKNPACCFTIYLSSTFKITASFRTARISCHFMLITV